MGYHGLRVAHLQLPEKPPPALAAPSSSGRLFSAFASLSCRADNAAVAMLNFLERAIIAAEVLGSAALSHRFSVGDRVSMAPAAPESLEYCQHRASDQHAVSSG